MSASSIALRFTAAASAVGLVVSHLVLFHAFYAGTQTFPFDFPQGYFAFVAYGTTAWQHGLLPEWVPFAGLGVPHLVNPQSGYFYPPFWGFALSGLRYTLQAATVVQALHVLFAAVGMGLLARTVSRRWVVWVLGACAYHFFGGFYSNAEHPDIVRAFAWLPWLFWAATCSRDEPELPWRALALPLLVFCSITGSYPGNIVSHLAVLGVYVLAQVVRAPAGPARRTAWALVGLLVLGVVLAAPALWPGLSQQAFITRGTGSVPEAGRMNWDSRNWLSLVLPWTITGFVHDHSMISAFVGTPVLVLAVLSTRAGGEAWWRWLGVGAIALVMLPGTRSVVYRGAAAVFPPLQYSRFSSSDYRALLACALIMLALSGLETFLQASADERLALLRRRTPVLVGLALVVLSGQWPLEVVPGFLVGVVAAGALTWAAMASLARWPQVPHEAPLAVIAAVVLFQGTWVVTAGSSSWHLDHPDAWLAGATGVQPGQALPVASALASPPAQRPARARDETNPWRGYVDGSYQASDIGGFITVARARVEADAVLSAFAAEPWRAVRFDAPPSCDELRARLASPHNEPSGVVTTRYGANEVDYAVLQPGVIVENELYFPGWQGVLDGRTALVAQPVCGALRSWAVPAGTSVLTTRFETPRLRAALTLMAAAALAYAAVVALVLVSRKSRQH
jgi:hypothetical protein